MNETMMNIRRIGTLMFAMMTLFMGLGVAHAQMSVGATPLKTALELNPGETQTFEIKAINRNEEPMAYKVEVQTAEAEGEFGNASFRPAKPEEKLAVPNWINIENPALTVPAREMSPVKFSITVPSDTPPGGYYGMVIFAPDNLPSGEGNVAIVGQIGTPLLIKVKGDINEEATIDSFELQKEQLFAGQPTVFGMKISNQGNVHILPEGKVFLYQNGELLREVANVKKDDGTTEVVDYLPLNPGKGYTLPTQPRMYSPTWEMNQVYGEVTAKYVVNYGKEQPQTIEGEQTFMISKDVEITGFTYDAAAQEFVVKLKNNGSVQMPVQGQINVYSNAGGDAKVTISFPLNNEKEEYLKEGEEKEVRVSWTGLEVLAPSKTNKFHAMLSYVIDEAENNVITAKAELPFSNIHGSAFDMETYGPYIIIGLLVMVIGVMFFSKKQRKEQPQQ